MRLSSNQLDPQSHNSLPLGRSTRSAGNAIKVMSECYFKKEVIIINTKHWPKGPDGTWKTGQRVPETGYWYDQYGSVAWFTLGNTFPPCIDRKGECAFRSYAGVTAAATA